MTKLILILLSFSVIHPLAIAKEYDTEQQASNLRDQFDKAVFIDHNLNRVELGYYKNTSVVKITTEQVGSRKTNTGTLGVWTTLKNRTDYDLQVEGRTMFFDENFIPLDDVTSWKRLYIPANGISSYKTSSMSFDATHYIIELREGR